MKVVLNPEYSNLKEFAVHLPETFEGHGEIVQARRNIIKSLNLDGLNLNIKRFRKPIFLNRIVYSFFRGTKASKAYYNALKVIEKGFSTPAPVCYIEEYKCGLLGLSYFVSTQLSNVKEIREYYYSKADNDKALLSAFARYTAALHNGNILHMDYSPGNILISDDNGEYNFSLVDINRMQFSEVDINKGCENFCRLFEYDEAASFIAKEYAVTRGFDTDTCISLVLKYKHDFERKKARKKRLKQIFK